MKLLSILTAFSLTLAFCLEVAQQHPLSVISFLSIGIAVAGGCFAYLLINKRQTQLEQLNNQMINEAKQAQEKISQLETTIMNGIANNSKFISSEMVQIKDAISDLKTDINNKSSLSSSQLETLKSEANANHNRLTTHLETLKNNQTQTDQKNQDAQNSNEQSFKEITSVLSQFSQKHDAATSSIKDLAQQADNNIKALSKNQENLFSVIETLERSSETNSLCVQDGIKYLGSDLISKLTEIKCVATDNLEQSKAAVQLTDDYTKLLNNHREDNIQLLNNLETRLVGETVRQFKNTSDQLHEIQAVSSESAASIAKTGEQLQQLEIHSNDIISSCNVNGETVSLLGSGLNGLIYHLSQLRLMVLTLRKDYSDTKLGADGWIFENDTLTKEFEPGRIKKVVDKESETETIFDYDGDGKHVTSEIYVKDTLRYKTKCSVYGNPVQGWEYDNLGNMLAEYCYDDLGQLKERKTIN